MASIKLIHVKYLEHCLADSKHIIHFNYYFYLLLSSFFVRFAKDGIHREHWFLSPNIPLSHLKMIATCTKTHKIPGHKRNQGGKRSVL